MRLYKSEVNAEQLSPLTLAFTGDAVFSLYIREMLVCDANRPVGELHKLSVQAVKASAQAEGMRKLLPLLTEKETDVFKRGRNAHTSHTPKNQSGCDYHYATGFEALIGYLYLKGENERLSLLLNEVIKSVRDDEGDTEP
ncbi:MAG: ribonuclease III [Oscillospiraceae bacterium]|nr:ribonuclease III [Oscillospiraceae bacterium]